MKNVLNVLSINDVKDLLDERVALYGELKVSASSGALGKAVDIKDQIRLLEEEINSSLKNTILPDEMVGKSLDVLTIRAAIKKATSKKLNDIENALLVPDGANGSLYLMPEGMSKRIHELIREYKSVRDLIGYKESDTLKGSFPAESFEGVPELLDWPDGTEILEDDTIEFIGVPYILKPKGALFKIGNTLLNKADEDLLEYVARVFAKMAVVTENKMAFDALNSGKVIVPIASADDLKGAWRSLDGTIRSGAVIVTNEDGIEYLENLRDAEGNPVLRPWSKNEAVMAYKDRPVHVFNNVVLPTVGTTPAAKVPMFIGNLREGATLVDMGRPVFRFTTHTGFTKNVSYASVMEYVDVVQVDGSDKAYQVCEFTV